MNETDFIEVMPSEKKPKDKRLDKMDAKFLPVIPSTFLILGQCGSGKSSCLWSLMTKGYTYTSKQGKPKSVFHELLVYLGTLDSQASFEKMPVKNKLILTEFDPVVFDEYCDDLKKHQMERLDKGKPALNTCIIFDDFFGANLMKKSRVNGAPPIEKLCLTSRHEQNATIFYCSQAYKQSGFTSPAVRANITTIILYKMPRNEIMKIADEYAEQYEVDEFIAIYDRVMASKQYAFCVWDRRRDMTKDRWTIGFSEPFPPSKKTMEMAKFLAGN
jgi:hypothetical protein